MQQVLNLARQDPRDTLDFLRRADIYPDRPDAVEIIETHFAWVLLSRQYVYKVKKPIRFHELDCTTLEKRRQNCELEVALNKRLAQSVYLGVVPLARARGGLSLEGSGEPVEWLVKMRRLPAAESLEQRALAGQIDDEQLRALMRKLAAFYARTARAPWTRDDYVQALEEQIRRCQGQLAAALAGTTGLAPDGLVDSLLRFVDRQRALLHERIDQGRVVDAHGDLRPEHVFLNTEPQIIDCLEFSSRLRLLDAAEEIGFLDLECARAGFPWVGTRLVGLYHRECDDPPCAKLMRFYRSQRALVRALLSAWHLDPSLSPTTARPWLDRTAWYLRTGAADIGAALG